MVTAQDKALAALCVERGLLDDEAIERARLAHANALESGGAPPLGNLLVQGGFLNARLASDLLRELALSNYRCARCNRAWSYEALSQLSRYRCEACGERLERVLARTPTGRFVAAPVKAEATEVLPRSISRGSSVSHVPIAQAHQIVMPSMQLAPSGPGPAVAPQEDGVLSPGKRIGPYEVVSELGRGAMGIVYLARRPGLERKFAIKVLLGGLLADPEAVERFRREAALASRVQHPSIVGVCDVGVVGGLHYYVMDYCAGLTLKQVLAERKQYPPLEAVELVAKIARGLAAAHALGIVHRDVKPANIILDARNNEPRIMDFGLARDASSSEVGMTRTGDIVGTPSYSSPEQLTGKRDVDVRVDVYALGVVLYELIAGTRPFHADTVAHLAAIVLTEDPKPLSEHVRDVPQDVSAIIGKAMAKDPAGRYRTAAELADDLERFVRGERVTAQPESRTARVWRKRRFAILGGLVALAVVGGGGLGLARAAHDQSIKTAREKLEKLDKRALQDDQLKLLAEALAEIGSSIPAEVAPAADVFWARTLHRRGRYKAARPLAEKRASGPGPEALEAKRILADILLAQGATADAQKLLASLADAKGSPFADWAVLRKAVPGDAQAAASVAAVRERVSAGADAPSLRLLAALDLQDGKEKSAAQILQRITDDVAKDDALAHLELAAALRRSFGPQEFSGQSDFTPQRHVADFERLAGEEAGESGLYHLMRAESLFAEKDYVGMVAECDAALARRVDNVDVHALRSWGFDEAALKSAARAKELNADRAKRLSPDPSELEKLTKSVSATAAARIEAAVAKADSRARPALAKALRASAEGKSNDSTLKQFEEAAAAAPGCPVTALERARAYVSRFQLARARTALDGARRAGADERDVLLLETVLAVRAQCLEQAADLAQRLATGADDARAAIARALVAAADGKREAVELATRAVSLAPGEGLAHLALADAVMHTDAERAVGEARAALALQARLDEEAELTLVRAQTYAISRSMNESEFRETLQRAARMMEHGPRGGPRGGWEGRDRGPPGERAGFETARALGTLLMRWEQLEMDYPSPRVVYLHGMTLFNMGLISELFFRKAIDDEDCVLGRAGLGLVFFEQKDKTRAAKEWRTLRAIDPRWRLPGNWVRILQGETELLEEFGKAP